MSLESLRYKRGSLQVLDQLLVPQSKEYMEVATVEAAWTSIRNMNVRGAPLIAIVAALGLAVEAERRREELASVDAAKEFLLSSMTYLRTSRPTAVNLFTATDELSALVRRTAEDANVSASHLIDTYISAAEAMLAADVAANKAMGDYGARRVLEATGRKSVRVLTICNTGSLATAGYGTALGVVRSLNAMGALEHVYACETRPYNQGARLTAFEIVEDKLPGTLVCDSMAAALMSVKGVHCVLVGADRVAANGDSANKIGTYMLAIVAKHHGVPFFVVSPSTTLDLSMTNGSKIHVEERPASELTCLGGQRIAAEGINAWNPSFDVTPASLITGIVTEVGVAAATENKDVIDVAAFLRAHGMEAKCANAVAPTAWDPTALHRLGLDAAVSPSAGN